MFNLVSIGSEMGLFRGRWSSSQRHGQDMATLVKLAGHLHATSVSMVSKINDLGMVALVNASKTSARRYLTSVTSVCMDTR